MTMRDEISSLLEEVRVRAPRAATYAMEKQRLNQAKAIDMLVVQALKLIEAEWNALLAEMNDLEGTLVRVTTEHEQARIAAAQPDVRWVDYNDSALGW